jgi:oxygen-independent coproporphyrinogen III oxidase
MLGVYVHLPFCPYICPYCDFAKWPIDGTRARAYLEALHGELDETPRLQARTLFLGGGTPNTYRAGDLVGLVRRLREHFSVPGGAEVTLEANPDRSLCNELGRLREGGINRLSFGVQSFVAQELRVLGRRHDAADVAAAVRAAREAGFDNLSLDLMFAVPGQTLRAWQETLDAAVALEVEHLSTYGLTIEPGTPYGRWFEREPGAFVDEETEAELFRTAIETLVAAGFEHYEISNFAKPGRRSAHNANYWANGEYVGLGVGAASYLGGRRSTHTRDLDEYMSAARERRPIPGESEELTGAARLGEATMLALRTREGVNVQSFSDRYGFDFLAHYAGVIGELASAGVLDADSTYVRLTERGRFVANDVARAFIA